VPSVPSERTGNLRSLAAGLCSRKRVCFKKSTKMPLLLQTTFQAFLLSLGEPLPPL